MRQILILIAIVVTAIFIVTIKSTDPEYRIVGISEGFIDIPCAKPKPGKICSAPDPDKIAFYIKALAQSISHPPTEKNYNSYAGMGLFISDKEIESVYEHRKRGGTRPNYLIGSHDDTIRISYSTEGALGAHLKRLNILSIVKYAEIASNIEGYLKYDDINCPTASNPINKKLLPEKQRWTCAELRKAIYVPEKHPGSLISCMQLISPEWLLTLHTCEITTEFAMGGSASYSIQSKHFLSGKWLELNTRITNYLNGLLIPANQGV